MNGEGPASTVARAMLPSIDMLQALRHGVGRATFTLGVAAGLALFAGGCASGEHDTSFDFKVDPFTGLTAFTGWTDITLGENVSSFGKAVLYGVNIQVEKPVNVTDLSFLSTLTGAATDPSGGAATTLVTLDSFPPGATNEDMQVVYFGDLRPLFDSTNTIRINWTGDVNPSFKGWPSDGSGIWVLGDVSIDVE